MNILRKRTRTKERKWSQLPETIRALILMSRLKSNIQRDSWYILCWPDFVRRHLQLLDWTMQQYVIRSLAPRGLNGVGLRSAPLRSQQFSHVSTDVISWIHEYGRKYFKNLCPRLKMNVQPSQVYYERKAQLNYHPTHGHILMLNSSQVLMTIEKLRWCTPHCIILRAN